jgi:hypothetical protein
MTIDKNMNSGLIHFLHGHLIPPSVKFLEIDVAKLIKPWTPLQ